MKPQAKTDIQIRGVPVTLRDQLRARAAARGKSVSQYVREVLEADVSRPSVREWFAEIERRGPIRLRGMEGKTIVDVLHEARRENGWED